MFKLIAFAIIDVRFVALTSYFRSVGSGGGVYLGITYLKGV